MELYIFRRFEYERLHNCTLYNVDSIPLSERQHPKIGSLLIGMAVVMELLYIPCLLSIWKRTSNQCYAFMCYIGLLDLIEIPISGVLTGIMAIRGDVFCSNADFIYVTGAFAFGLYCSVSLASILLAFNRCTNILWPKFNEKFFRTNRIHFWLAIPSLYGFYCVMFCTPVKFSSYAVSWFNDPFAFYKKSESNGEYTNVVQIINNTMESVGLMFIYTAFCILLGFQTTNILAVQTVSNRKRRAQYRSFIQVFIISLVNMVACTIYVLMNYVKLNKTLIVIGSFGWLFIHGIPPFIYLTLNQTIRKDITQMFKSKSSIVPRVGSGIQPKQNSTDEHQANDTF
ncbi:hypothetical protein M3Y95_00993200 [Aphelenchoides besseyi]|nr:hypothetical protein M3Y95_00993200 [Aphelenchoides besseyi]